METKIASQQLIFSPVQGELALTQSCQYLKHKIEKTICVSQGKSAQCKVDLHIHSHVPDAAKTPMSESFKVQKVQGLNLNSRPTVDFFTRK